jgi:hypothetical protein
MVPKEAATTQLSSATPWCLARICNPPQCSPLLHLWEKAKAPQDNSAGKLQFAGKNMSKACRFQRYACFGLQVLDGVTPFWSVPNPGFDRVARSGLLNLTGI